MAANTLSTKTREIRTGWIYGSSVSMITSIRPRMSKERTSQAGESGPLGNPEATSEGEKGASQLQKTGNVFI